MIQYDNADINVALRIENLTLGYDRRPLISNLSVDIPTGRLIALLGRNGSGKSTFLKTVSGVSKPVTGTVWIDGVDVSTMNPEQIARRISFVGTERVRIPDLKCFDLVALGRFPYTDWIGRLTANDRDIVEKSIEMVGMSAYLQRSMDKMSDGECQKIMIARALAQDTPVILMDEPTSFLDYHGRRETIALLKRLTVEKGKTIIFSTHDIELVKDYIDYALVFNPPHGFLSSGHQLSEDNVLGRLFGC